MRCTVAQAVISWTFNGLLFEFNSITLNYQVMQNIFQGQTSYGFCFSTALNQSKKTLL